MARPTTYTPELGAAIVKAVRETACSRVAAAEASGIPESTLREWLSRQDDFATDLRIAQGERKMEAAQHLRDAALRGDIAAIIFRAKCLDPDQYTEKKDRHLSIETQDGGIVIRLPEKKKDQEDAA